MQNLGSGDIEAVERQAHSIKGATANISGEALRAVAFEMEMNGKSRDLDAVRKLMGELETQFFILEEVSLEDIRLI